MKLPVLSLLLCLFLTSCTEEESQLQADLNAQTWNLTKLTLDGKDVDLSPSPLEDRTLHFHGGRVAGTAGVNTFQVTFKITDPDILSPTPDGGGMTEMDGPPHIMELESVYLSALWKVRKAEIKDETLTLSGDGVLMKLVGTPAPPIAPVNPEDTDSRSVDDEDLNSAERP
ncbi:MAG: META domain-containing protein [Verrucomicrobiales bacterium]|jgi:heat shock protein HslJ|nr:META domain-containing protein [Verrucomicrobiales bacterium]